LDARKLLAPFEQVNKVTQVLEGHAGIINEFSPLGVAVVSYLSLIAIPRV
jgi:hypothetical protein